MEREMEIAPLRSIDDFILSKARFQLPNLNDSNKWPNRVINNLMYYQTNYFLLNCVIFGGVLLYKPKRIITDGVLLPMMLNFLHASFRMRNAKNKLAGKEFYRYNKANCYFTRLNLKKMGPLQFCLSVFFLEWAGMAVPC